MEQGTIQFDLKHESFAEENPFLPRKFIILKCHVFRNFMAIWKNDISKNSLYIVRDIQVEKIILSFDMYTM